MEITLKGLVVSKYGSAGKFAQAMGWSGRKGRDIVSGRQHPTARDMEEMADALDIRSPEAFCAVFFKSKSTKWTSERTA